MINMLVGLPRSGSTLLANVLAQHPDLHVSGTSSLAGMVDAVQGVLSTDPTVISELESNPQMYARYQESIRGLVEGFYSGIEKPNVLDKGRLWPILWPLVHDIWPEAHMIVTVRDPRDVVASIERSHRATGVFRSPVKLMLTEAASQLMSPEGIVGGPIRMAMDLMDRQAPGIVFVRYETFAVAPQPILSGICKSLGLAQFDFNVTDVASTGGDTDTVWRGKYPHVGTGAIAPSASKWSDVMAPELAAKIAEVNPRFMATFAYKEQRRGTNG